jgi:hypothetical protein
MGGDDGVDLNYNKLAWIAMQGGNKSRDKLYQPLQVSSIAAYDFTLKKLMTASKIKHPQLDRHFIIIGVNLLYFLIT